MRDLNLAGVRAYRLIIRLDDYVWFASHEWANDNETAPVLHGYALSFGLSRRDRVLTLGGVPTYEEDLAAMPVYCTPASLAARDSAKGTRTVLTFNSIDEPTQLTQALGIGDKVNDPKFGRRQVLVPGLRFELVAFARFESRLPRVFRLGKKRSPVVVEVSEELTGKRYRGGATPWHAVSPLDVAGRVVRCVPRAIPPHLVFERAEIEDDYFLANDRGPVHLPKRVQEWLSE